MSQYELQQRAQHHANEAERLLAGKLGVITNMVKAGVHATLAVYYATQAQREAYLEHSE
ncbi:MAG: hypothetical protein JO363_14405 [Solirubrobacterales bacterium]|nr:hypothetical protein [Solirubrobacterales bacterium]